MSIDTLFAWLLDFSFYYPLFMSYTWVTGALYYFFYREHHEHRHFEDPPPLVETPGVSFIVPCHDEGENALETVRSLLDQDYPDFEIIAVNNNTEPHHDAPISSDHDDPSRPFTGEGDVEQAEKDHRGQTK